jgi:hypothetical protein
MKPRPVPLLLVVAAVAAAWGLMAAGAFSPALLVMSDGRRVAADVVRVQGGTVIYHRAGTRRSAPRETVQAVVTGFPRTVADSRHRLGFAAERIRRIGEGWVHQRSVTLPVAVCLLAGLILAGCLLIWPRRKRAEPVVRAPEIPPQPRRPVLDGPRLAGAAEVEQFFLDLYRRQIGAPPNAPGRFETVRDIPGGPLRICRLSIKIGDDWKDRRMTMGPIGEGSGSRSQCFYVIFDTHMVIKIPPAPVRDFADYLQRIRYESALVARLSPRECIIPTVSVILRRIHRIPDIADASAAAVEARYIEVLERAPEYRDFIRIGGAFAFFMDLSRHRFLGQVLADMDEGQAILAHTIASDAALMDDCQGFEPRYGERYSWICDELQRQSRRFTAAVRDFQGENDDAGHLPDHRLREAFLARLAGVEAAGAGLPQALLEKLADPVPGAAGTPADAVRTYRTIARAHSEQKVFARNRSRMEALAARLLDLLAWLAKRGVAMRDLKPDNLLVAGESDDYPLFLTSARAFTIGMIDLETAVDVRPEQEGGIRQPQLGGTPAYATPSHFLPNRILTAVYPDPAKVFHFQDWHAVAGIVFEVVTGRRLFSKTANRIPAVMVRLRQAASRKQSLGGAFSSANADFWGFAEKEFDARVRACDARLSAVRVQVPRAIVNAMQVQLAGERTALALGLEQCRERPSAPASEKDCQTLLGCTPAQIQHLQVKYRGSNNPSLQKACAWLDTLLPMKLRLETVSGLSGALSGAAGNLTADTLLRLMFHTTAGVMAAAPGLAGGGAMGGAADPVPVSTAIRAGQTVTIQLPE